MLLISFGLAVLAIFGVILLARPRRFYFVRHGETILNQQHIRQGEDGGLSENGKRQSEKVGAYLKRFSIDRIISSTYPRARESAEMDLAYHKDDYRFSDEENFIDLKKRAHKCLNLLARQGNKETVVVTHHVFLKMLVAYMLYRERLHAADFTKLSFFNVSDNAGITICEFHPWRFFSPTRGWEVVSYNEQPS